MPRKYGSFFKLAEDAINLPKAIKQHENMSLLSLDMEVIRGAKNVLAAATSASDTLEVAPNNFSLLNEKIFGDSLGSLRAEPRDEEYVATEGRVYDDLSPDALKMDHYEIDEDGNVMHLPDVQQLGHLNTLSSGYEGGGGFGFEDYEEEEEEEELPPPLSNFSMQPSNNDSNQQELANLSVLLVPSAEMGIMENLNTVSQNRYK